MRRLGKSRVSAFVCGERCNHRFLVAQRGFAASARCLLLTSAGTGQGTGQSEGGRRECRLPKGPEIRSAMPEETLESHAHENARPMKLTEEQKKEQAIAVQEFATQALTVGAVGVYRLQKGRIEQKGYQAAVLKLTVRYLNQKWLALLKGEDFMALDLYDRVAQNAHSPVCVNHIIFAVCRFVADKLPSDVPGPTGDSMPTENDVKFVRQKVKADIAAAIKEFQALKDPFDHVCEGPTLDEIRQDWEHAGREEHDFFNISPPPPPPQSGQGQPPPKRK